MDLADTEQRKSEHSESSPSVDKIISSFNKTAEKKARNRENLLLAYTINATERVQRKNIMISKLQGDLQDSEENVYLLKMESEAKEELLKSAEDKLRSCEELLKSKDNELNALKERVSSNEELEALKRENQLLKAQLQEASAKPATSTKSKSTPKKLQKPEAKHVALVKPSLSTASKIPRSPATPSLMSNRKSTVVAKSPSISSLSSVARLPKSPSFPRPRFGSAASSLASSPASSPASAAKAIPAKPVSTTAAPDVKKRPYKKSRETTGGMSSLISSVYNLRKRGKKTE